VENWSRSIETDMRTISSALEYAYKSKKCLLVQMLLTVFINICMSAYCQVYDDYHLYPDWTAQRLGLAPSQC